MAVKIVDAPVHNGLVPVVIAMLTAGVTNVFTVIVMVFDVTVAAEGQVALLVISQVTVCPFVKVVVVNVVPPDPALTPFTFHW